MAVDSAVVALPEDGTVLLTRMASVADAARASGALRSIPTEFQPLTQGGIRYALRVVDNLRRREAATPVGPRPVNPFLPYEPALYVCHAPPTHVVLMNKYNVIEPHLLLVTAQFESQSAPLTLEDFEAAAALRRRLGGLVFYNGGGRAGASQPHKHLQWVPCGLLPGEADLPIESAIDPLLSRHDIQRVPGLPYAHALQARQPTDTPEDDLARYHQLLMAAGVAASEELCEDYNWLMTRRWMMVVPRTAERWQGLSINALAFAGALLARDEAEAERIRQAGPASVLRAVTA